MHMYYVESADQITASTLQLHLKRAGGESAFSFLPGQYAAISFYRNGRPTAARCFSIVSSPAEQSILQFSMRTRGHYTKALTGLKHGDTVMVRGPFGGFVLDLAKQNDMVFLAGGIGITPFISMTRFANDVQLQQKIQLIYSCQSQDDIPFYKELVRLQMQNPNFEVTFVIGDGPTNKMTGQHVISGRMSPDALDDIVQKVYANKTFFMCGPPPFMNAMQNTLKNKGVTQDRIITETFAQGSHKQTGKIKSWPYNIYVLGTTSMVLGSFIVMASDLFKTLPPTLKGTSIKTTSTLLTNNRQNDLDALVNELPDLAPASADSDAVQVAVAAATQSAALAAAAQSNNGAAPKPRQTVVTQLPTSVSPTSKVAPTPVATPAPVVKKCTTTQSGVTTCV